jgi:hypothetical protein
MNGVITKAGVRNLLSNGIPVDNIGALLVPKSHGKRYISIGVNECTETFEVIRQNPPSKKYPKGSITVKSEDQLFLIYQEG